LSDKYIQALEIYSQMTNKVPVKRPNCEVILKAQQSWALHETEFNIENELNLVFESESEFKGNNLLIHAILESKFIAIKAKKIERRQSSALETLNNFEHKLDIIEKFLVKLKNYSITNFELRTKLIDCLVNLMKKYSNSTKILNSLELNAISCLYSFIENNSIEQSNQIFPVLEDKLEKINPKQIENVVEVMLTAMELYPNHQQLQKSALIILYSEQILDNITSESYKCTKLVMDSLVNFKDREMNLIASVICSTHFIKLSITDREVLCSSNVYIKTLLSIINSLTYYDLIENSLSALVNLLVDSSKNCSKFLDLKGLDVSFSLLEVRLNQLNRKFFINIFSDLKFLNQEI
jgi:Zyg-11 family protein